jgi:hypothetical protein
LNCKSKIKGAAFCKSLFGKKGEGGERAGDRKREGETDIKVTALSSPMILIYSEIPSIRPHLPTLALGIKFPTHAFSIISDGKCILYKVPCRKEGFHSFARTISPFI